MHPILLIRMQKGVEKFGRGVESLSVDNLIDIMLQFVCKKEEETIKNGVNRRQKDEYHL